MIGKDGGSLARIAVGRSKTWVNATAAVRSINIVPPHFEERTCSKMMQNATSKPGHHL
ncbi:hypothetical protein GTF97_19220 [Roseobacter sp. HKCCD8767]|uniref:hypothetical protein n=1 Tax=unclassified Roseobacter TaxID=196798 RepID=UPI0014921FE8|nr:MULTISPECIES: hypothetical protein [unclassified Roseobacter]NNW81027.1 hypothetical protein [Roseobacter sp. HKCCD8134]NNX36465.1 hypothetical protein [Roseobacter sp. HKCCD8418]NNY30170.1 hypothetical protein [Roseobacter sp. HKCCD9199]NNY42948.1 hypothetical protein [Roseobacter sp. HKCCD8831]NNY60032.1 hypothetical protein [Roseobacter sp. HKCCD6795]NNY64243.1 hypothetical protein [Roseobacter sp. HKCCD8499]NNZ66411.1 hypothetical protein [Roseobacter sp. HKCCD5928]NOA85541.1 hypothe